MASKKSLLEQGLEFKPTAKPLAWALFFAGITSGCSSLPQAPNLTQLPKINLPTDKAGNVMITPETVGPIVTGACWAILALTIVGSLTYFWTGSREQIRTDNERLDAVLAARKTELEAERNAPREMSPFDQRMNNLFDRLFFPIEHPIKTTVAFAKWLTKSD